MASRRDAILRAAAKAIARRGVRGLRVEEVAREAGVSLGLVYYHFTDRAGLLADTFRFVNDRAADYVAEAVSGAANARDRVEQMLLFELQDDPLVIENSAAWGELRASAIFEEFLREPLRRTTRRWNDDVAEAIESAQAAGLADARVDPQAAAARLTALVEGLSDRWLSESLELEEARGLLAGAVAYELRIPPGGGDALVDGTVPSRAPGVLTEK
jgi:AcrR family transcriptional regulator